MRIWEWSLLAILVGITRLAHAGILWVEEAYPAAAAIQMRHGLWPYRDFFYDKPPLPALLYRLTGITQGVELRILGALFVVWCAWLMADFARECWGESESRAAAWLTAFFLTFDTPSAVMALAPDLLMFVPHVAAVWLAWRKRALASGIVCGLALLTNAKAALLIPVCMAFAGGFAWPVPLAAIAFATLPVWISGYGQQVWEFGSVYAKDTFVTAPFAEGAQRTAGWLGFHAAIVIPAAWAFWRERDWRWMLWIVLSCASVVMGLRFFPRYYFALLPVTILLAARGLQLLPRAARLTALALLLIPAIRFGPRFLTLYDAGDAQWSDTAMNRDSRKVRDAFAPLSLHDETVFVWGYRPDILVYLGQPIGAPFLDSQPLTGVLADRHLTSTHVTAPELVRTNRAILAARRPTFVIDGLGLYNPKLAITEYPELAAWLSENYKPFFSTDGTVVYRLAAGPAR
ncbi:MAG: hypothetical protein ABI972_09415 [Acidobacteriota bacterium]